MDIFWLKEGLLRTSESKITDNGELRPARMNEKEKRNLARSLRRKKGLLSSNTPALPPPETMVFELPSAYSCGSDRENTVAITNPNNKS